MNIFKIFQSKKEEKENMITENVSVKQIAEALEKVIDPETGVNIVDLGLIYGIFITESEIFIKMTMTTSSCPMVGLLIDMSKENVEMLNTNQAVDIELVWQPRWKVEMMSESAKKQLG